MVARQISRELLAYVLIAFFAATSAAQTLGDMARQQRQKQNGGGKEATFSNIDNPPAQAKTAIGKRAPNANADEQELLQIDLPADGIVVNPGDTIRVRVSARTAREISAVAVMGEDPMGMSETRHSLPAEFSITVPAGINRVGHYSLTAMGVIASGGLADSASVDIDVERPDMPVSIEEANRWNAITLDFQGESHGMQTLATFADGKILDVSESSRLSFQSTDANIVTVDASGNATAVATGAAAIVVSYSNPDGPNLQRKFPVSVSRFALTFVPSSLDFGEVPVGSSARLLLTVKNNTLSDNQMKIVDIEAIGPYSERDTCTASSPLPVGSTCQITVTFAPAVAGQREGRLTVVDSLLGGRSVILLSGVGAR